MTIKKFGQCCLLITTNGITILTDPGSYSTMQNDAAGIDIILITHEHQDHFHLESVKKVLANNPNAKIITNASVGKLLDAENIPYEVVAEGGKSDAHGVLVEGYGHKHAEIYKELGQVENTSYFIDGKLFYPGDAFMNPDRAVDILALPVAGPWMKISEAINYAFALKPRIAFPVHDAIMKQSGFMHGMYQKILSESIDFVPMAEEDEKEF